MTDSNNVEVNCLKTQLVTARNEISNLRQQIKSLKHTYRKDCDEIKQQLENWKCQQCKNTPLACVNQSEPIGDVHFSYVGIVSTHFPEKRGTPRQPGICPDSSAKLILNNVVFTNPEHSLEGLHEYSHMWILFHFHNNDSNHTRAKVSPPRLNGLRTGVFATRSPHRPCPIGLSLVRIDRIVDNIIYFSGVDMIDQTPVLDIKPYIPQYDSPNAHAEEFDASLDSLLEASTVSSFSINDSHVRVMDGEENGIREQAFIGSSSSNSQNVSVNLEETYHETRSVSRIGEREAPDGEEEEVVSSGSATDTFQNRVRVPSWIQQSSIPALTVYFKQRALVQLQQLGNDGEQKKNIIKSILREDPRSVYLRERVENSNYVFRIADLYVSCKFDDSAHIVTVFQVFQDSVNQGDDIA